MAPVEMTELSGTSSCIMTMAPGRVFGPCRLACWRS
uniref:Uncharacterized protein MANES_08G081400 n=1 Tax=Rhizophora mucronata TaxID=61149 RepID=A0A2P2PKQ1_RHIMU